jgi:hypothetical protein
MKRLLPLIFCVFWATAARPQVSLEILVNPYPSPYLSDWEKQTETIQFLITNEGNSDLEVKGYARLISDAHGEIFRGWSQPITIPAGETETVTSDEVVDYATVEYNEDLRQQILSTGRIPEGIYTLHVQIFLYEAGQTELMLTEGEAEFTILGFAQPALVSPLDDEVLSSRDVVFEWESTTDHPDFEVRYHLRIFEMRPGQTPIEAVEANRVFYEKEVVSTLSFLYPEDAPEFIPGVQYAWYVQATDMDGRPLGENQGRSEIWTFWFQSRRAGKPVAFDQALQEIVLVPNLAVLADLSDLEMQVEGDIYTFSGTATLDLIGLPGNPRLQATVDALQVDLSDPANPVVLDGIVEAEARGENLGVDLAELPLVWGKVRYSPAEGLTVDILLQVRREEIAFEGRLTLTSNGPEGVVVAEADPGSSLFELGDDLVRVRVFRVEVSFPDPYVTVEGNVLVFGQDVGCEVRRVALENGALSVDFDCTPNTALPLVENSDLLTLHLESVRGTISMPLEGVPDYDLIVRGGLDFSLSEGPVQTFVQLRVTPDSVEVQEFRALGDFNSHPLDLGWIRVTLLNVTLDHLVYRWGSEPGWDFRLTMDIQISFPRLNNLQLPPIEDVVLDEKGFHVPPQSRSGISLPVVFVDGFELVIDGYSLPGFTYHWFEDVEATGSEWEIRLSLDLSLPELPSSYPPCIRRPRLRLENVVIGSQGLSADIDPVPVESCPIPLGGGTTLFVRQIGGHIEIGGPGYSYLTIDAQLMLPENLRCGDYVGPEISAKLTSTGLILGRVEGIVPPCPLYLGPLQFAVTNATILLGEEEGQQTAVLQMEGTLIAPGLQPGQEITAAGIFRYDLIRGRLVAGSAVVEGPFQLALPPEQPLFTFVIDRAVLDTAGLHISGSQTLRADGAELTVVFEDVTFDLVSRTVKAGRITFAERFSLEIALGSGALTWKAVPYRAETAEEPVLRLDLAGAIGLDSAGFHIFGQDAAFLRYRDRVIDSLRAAFENLTVALDPVRVTDGQAILYYQDDEVGRLTPDGFIPNLSFFAERAIPDTIPLPSEQIAYLIVRENGELVLDASTEEGMWRLTTRPGRPVRLVLPAFQFDAPEPPRVMVNFDVTMNPEDFSVVSGSIQATVQIDLAPANLPFVVTDLEYSGSCFTVSALMELFDSQVSGLTLRLCDDGRLTGDVALAVGQTFPILEGVLSVRVDSVRGNLNADLVGPTAFELRARSELQLTLSPTESCRDTVWLVFTQEGMRVDDFNPVCEGLAFDFGWIRLALADLSFEKLAWNSGTGWQFAFAMDVNLDFPDWGIQLPAIHNVRWNDQGFDFPETEFPDLEGVVPPFEYQGFQLQPLAFRMDSLHVPWSGGGAPEGTNWGLGFDFELNLKNLPLNWPDCIRNPKLTLLNATYQDGRLSGAVELKVIDEPGCPVPLGEATLHVLRLGGGFSIENGQQTGYVEIGGRLTLPPGLSCGDTLDLGDALLRISSSGLVTGIVLNVVPRCRLQLGPFVFQPTRSSLRFTAEDGQQRALLRLEGLLKAPGETEGDTVTVAGTMVYDLVENRIVEGLIRIDRTFRLRIPQEDPVLTFVVNRAVLTPERLTVSGRGTLLLEEGARVDVLFENFGLTFPELLPRWGKVVFMGRFALKITAGQGRLKWQAVDTTATSDEDFVIMLTLPEVRIEKDSLLATGESRVYIRYQGNELPNVRAVFSPDFALGFDPFRIISGQVDFYLDDNHIAVLNRDGFFPQGGLLRLAQEQIPARIPLPDTSIAYLEIKDENGNLRLAVESTDQGLRLSGHEVPLVAPGLAYGGEVPRWNIDVEAVLNPTDWSLVSGSIGVSAPPDAPLMRLRGVGIPAEIRSVRYENVGGESKLLVSARLELPPVLSKAGTELILDSLEVSSSGLRGTVRLLPGSGQEYVSEVPLGEALTVRFREVTAVFGSFACTLLGDLVSPVFADTAMPFVANLDTSGMQVTPSAERIGVLPLGVAEFEPRPLGGSPAFRVTVGETFELVISGIFRVPDLNSLELTIQELTITPEGVAAKQVSATAEQMFELYGATFRVTQMGFSYESGVLTVILSGKMTFLEHEVDFAGLMIRSDGKVSIGRAIYEGEIVLVDPYVKLVRLELRADSLTVHGVATLPEPLVQEPQNFTFSIGPRGVSGVVRIVAISEETPRLDGNREADATEVNFGGIGTLDLIYLAVELNFGSMSSSSVQGVLDFYLENDADKRIRVGRVNRSEVHPGVLVTFGGQVQWGDVSYTDGLAFGYRGFELALTEVSISGENDFKLLFSGNLRIGLQGVGGSLGFENWGIGTDGVIVGSVQSGTFTVTELLTISVTEVSYSMEPATIELNQASYGASNAPPSAGEQTIQVDWYFSFGAQITIVGMAGGGVDRLLIFQTGENANLIIENANLQVPQVVDITVDFQYLSLESGFKVMLAGSGEFGAGPAAIRVGVAGKVAYLNGESSFGFFLLVEGAVRVPLAPGVFATGFGGGFFYNPDPYDLQIVRTLCGFPEAAGSIRDPGAFAAFFYGSVALVDEYAVEGAALITLTQNFFSVDAKVVLLHMDAYLYGRMNLTFGLSAPSVEGTIEVTLAVGDLLVGTQQISAYYYGENAWAILGTLQVNVLSFITANGDFYIGPPGLLVNLRSEVSYNILIVQASGGLDGMVWYVQNVSWGGYFRSYVAVEVLLGVASAQGWLECTVVQPQAGDFFIYGVAGLELHVVGYDWEGSVWVKIMEGGRVDAGYGSDPELDRLVEEAVQTAARMGQAGEEAQAQLAEARSQTETAGLPTDPGAWMAELQRRLQAELSDSEIRSCQACLELRRESVDRLVSKRRTLLEDLGRLTEQVITIEGRLSNLRIEVPGLPEVETYTLGDSPVQMTNLGAVEGGAVDSLTLANMGFELNADQASAQQNTASEADQVFSRLEEEIKQQIDQIWNQAILVANTLSGASSSVGSLSQEIADGVASYYGDFFSVLNDVYWACLPNRADSARHFTVVTRDAAAEEHSRLVEQLTRGLGDVEAAVDSLYGLEYQLVAVLWDLYDRLRYRNQSVLETGGTGVSSGSRESTRGTAPGYSTAGPINRSGGRKQAGIVPGWITRGSGRQGSVNRAQFVFGEIVRARLTGLLPVILRTQAQAERMLQVPRVTGISVATEPVPWRAGRVRVHFSAEHADRVVEYAFQFQPSGMPPDPRAWIPLGQSTSFAYLFVDDRSPESQTLYIRARGSGGSTNVRSAAFTVAYGPWRWRMPPSSGSESAMASDTTPPARPSVRIPLYVGPVSEFGAEWRAEDSESGIIGCRYRVYKYRRPARLFREEYGAELQRLEQAVEYWGVQEVPLWASGAIPFDSKLWEPVTEWRVVGGLRRVTVRGVELEDNAVYRVGVQAVNGDSLWSGIGYSNPMMTDFTPPDRPDIQDIRTLALRTVRSKVEVNYRPVLEMRWKGSSDGESGVRTYQIAFTGRPLSRWPGDEFIDVGQRLSWRQVGDPFTFGDTIYVNVVAVNHAGVPSEIHSSPVFLEDPTPPLAPHISVPRWVSSGSELIVRVVRPSEDPETGIVAYECGVSGDAGAAPARWTTIAPRAETGQSGYEPSALQNLWLKELSLQHNASYYAVARAVNGSGLRSRIASSGSFRVDLTPPRRPIVRVSVNRSGGVIVALSSVQDPESGIVSVQIAFGSRRGGDDILGWRRYTGRITSSFEWRFPYDQLRNQVQSGRLYWVTVRVKNAAGSITEVSRSFQYVRQLTFRSANK